MPPDDSPPSDELLPVLLWPPEVLRSHMMAGLVEDVSGRTLLVVDVVENMEENYLWFTWRPQAAMQRHLSSSDRKYAAAPS